MPFLDVSCRIAVCLVYIPYNVLSDIKAKEKFYLFRVLSYVIKYDWVPLYMHVGRQVEVFISTQDITLSMLDLKLLSKCRLRLVLNLDRKVLWHLIPKSAGYFFFLSHHTCQIKNVNRVFLTLYFFYNYIKH